VAIDGVIGKDAGCGALGAGKTDLGVDVEWEGLAARRPDGGGERNIVGDGVIGRERAGERRLRRDLVWLTGEVVSCLLDTSDASVKANVTTELGAEDAVLEARWILKIQVQLAVLAGLCCGDAGADGGDVGVEDQGESSTVLSNSDIYHYVVRFGYPRLSVVGDERSHTALWTTSSTIGDGVDVDLGRVGSNRAGGRGSNRDLKNRGGDDGGGARQDGDDGKHIDGCKLVAIGR